MIGLGQFRGLGVTGVSHLRRAAEENLVDAGRELRVEIDLGRGCRGRLGELDLGHFELGRQARRREGHIPFATGTTDQRQRDRDLPPPRRFPDLRFGRGDGERRGVASHRERNVVELVDDPWHILAVGVEAERCHARRVNDLGLTDLCPTDDADRSRPGLHPLGGRKDERRPVGAGRRDRGSRADAGGEPLGFNRYVAGKTVGAEDHDVDRRRAADVDHRRDDVGLVGVGPVLLRQQREDAEVGGGLARHEHPGVLGGGPRIGLEIAHQDPVGAIGRRLELNGRIGRGAVDGAADELGRAVVHEGNLLPDRISVGASRDALDRQAGVGLEAESVGDEIEDERVAGFGFERKPVAVATRMEPARERGGEGDGLGCRWSVVRLGFDHRSRGRQERRGEWLRSTGNVTEEIDQIGRGIAGGEQPPGVAHRRAAGGIAGTDVDRDLLERCRPLLGGKGREGRRSAAGEPHAVDVDLQRLSQPGDRRKDEVDLRRRRHAEPVVVVVAAGGVEIVDPHHVAPLGGGGEVEERIVGMVAAGGGQDAAAGIENVEDRGHPRVDPPGPDLGADPLTSLEGYGVMVRLASRGPRGDRRVGGHILRLGKTVGLAGLRDLGGRSDEERARAAHAVAADGDDVIQAGRHVGGDRDDHSPRDGTRLRVELRRCGHLRCGRDAGVGEDELLEVVEVGAEERDSDL